MCLLCNALHYYWSNCHQLNLRNSKAFYLSPEVCVHVFLSQISSAFKNFGVSGDERCCLIGKLVADSDNDCTDMDEVCSTIRARQLPLTSIREFNDDDRIKKVCELLCWVSSMI